MQQETAQLALEAPVRREAPVDYEPPKALLESIRAELRRMLDADPFDQSSLLTIGDFANAAHGLVMAHNPMAKLNGRRLPSLTPSGFTESYSMGAPVSPVSNTTENVGARVMKELAAMIGKPKPPSQVTLVRALAEARELGLDDVAAKLEAELGVEKKPNGKPPPTPAPSGKQVAGGHLVSTKPAPGAAE